MGIDYKFKSREEKLAETERLFKLKQQNWFDCSGATYYLIHEGAHLITALSMGVFKEVKFLGLGMQVDVDAAQMTDLQMGIFRIAGVVCTLIAAVLLTLLSSLDSPLRG